MLQLLPDIKFKRMIIEPKKCNNHNKGEPKLATYSVVKIYSEPNPPINLHNTDKSNKSPNNKISLINPLFDKVNK